MMIAITNTEPGIAFLQWLVRMSGFNRPIMSLEDASRRDIWLTIRPYVPIEKLSEIEHADLRDQQKTLQEIYEAMPKGESNE